MSNARISENALAAEAEPLTVPLWPVAARMLGIGRCKAFELAHSGEFPVRVLRLGSRFLVSRKALLRYINDEPSEVA